MAYRFRRVRLFGFPFLWQQAAGLCSSSPLAEDPSRCPERLRGWMMCPHSMASCGISVFSQYRFVRDAIYRSRTGILTLRSCLLVLSFIIIILITKHPIWPRLWGLAQPVTVQYSVAVHMTDHGGMHAASGVILRSKRYLEPSDLVKGSVLYSWR